MFRNLRPLRFNRIFFTAKFAKVCAMLFDV